MCHRAWPSQGLIQAVFKIDIPILGTLIWTCANLILISKIKLPLYVIAAFDGISNITLT